MAHRDDQISGVRGWLLLLVLILGLFVPLVALMHILDQFYLADQPIESLLPGWPAFRASETALDIVHIALSLIIAWRLCAVFRWDTVRFAIAGIWITGIGASLVDLSFSLLILDRQLAATAEAEAIPAISAAAYCTLWTAYLLRSRRVANTYPRPSDEDRLAAVFD